MTNRRDSSVVSARLTPQELLDIKALAEALRCSRSEVLRLALVELLDRRMRGVLAKVGVRP